MVVLTTAMVARIRQLRAEGVTLVKTAQMVGVSKTTVEKYQTPQAEAREKRRHEQDRQKPETIAKRRAAACAWYYRNKAT
jgi:predicted transcriptional regulator